MRNQAPYIILLSRLRPQLEVRDQQDCSAILWL